MEKFDLFLFEEHFSNGGSVVKEGDVTVSMCEFDEEYVVSVDRDLPCMVSVIKIYDADTLALKTKGDCLKQGGTRIGVWKTYDQFGEIIEEVNYDEGWKINWEQLQPILIADGIKNKQITNICRVPDIDDEQEPEESEQMEDSGEDIWKSRKPKEYDHVWIVSVMASSQLLIDAIYDGNTGERVGTEFKPTQS